MNYFSPSEIIFAAFILDFMAGDPECLPHPVRWMGNAITMLEPFFRKISTNLVQAGAFFSIFLILSVWLLSFLLLKAAFSIMPFFCIILEVLMIYYSLSAVSLEKAAMDVYASINKNELGSAIKQPPVIHILLIERLKKGGISRAVVETVAENLVDGVIAPLFYAAIGGAPLAMAYKMVNTLDSMVGYKNEKYEKFGKASARIDDVFNYIPARICVPVISIAAQILSGKGACSFKTSVQEGRSHSSPNAGYPEAAFAGTLCVTLGGPNYYHGHLVCKPYIGKKFGRIKIRHIKQACDLMLFSSFLWLIILCIVLKIAVL